MSNFNSRFLTQYSTKFNDSKFMLLYNPRSTGRISQLQQLLRSNSNLLEMAVLDSCVPRSEMLKQMMLDDVEDDWNRSCSSLMLPLQESSICHGWTWWWQSRFLNALAKVLWNSSSIIPVEDRSNKNQQKEWRNSMEMVKKVWKSLKKIERILVISEFRSEIVNCD